MRDVPGPAPFLVEQLEHLARVALCAPEAPVLDLACGSGRNALAVARRGLHVVGLDRDASKLHQLVREARSEGLPVGAIQADLEDGTAMPLARGRCTAILVFRYLYRPLAPLLVEGLRPGGLLIYETFTLCQRGLAQGPSNPAFLLEPGELPGLFPGLQVEQSFEGWVAHPWPQYVARLVARKPR